MRYLLIIAILMIVGCGEDADTISEAQSEDKTCEVLSEEEFRWSWDTMPQTTLISRCEFGLDLCLVFVQEEFYLMHLDCNSQHWPDDREYVIEY